jgi:hypothetical protein
LRRGVGRDRQRWPKIEDDGSRTLCSSVRQRERVPDDEKLQWRPGKKTGAPGRGPVRRRQQASSLAANGAATEELLAATRARMERCGALAGAEKKV